VTATLIRGFRENGTDTADANWLLIEDGTKVVLHRAGKYGGALHQRKSSLTAVPPGGLHLGGAKLGIRLST
jgi:hypothetical protein